MHILIVGGGRVDRHRAALAQEQAGSFRPASRLQLDAASLPSIRPHLGMLPVAEPRLVRVDDLEKGFPMVEGAVTRPIITQSTYILQKWIDVLGAGDRIVATANRDTLARNAPEAFARRGPWRFVEIIELQSDPHKSTADHAEIAENTSYVSSAGSVNSAVDLLFKTSAYRNQMDLHAARVALDEAVALAPEWEAVHYEYGKYWLACNDMERACDSFQRAADLMPTFSSAFSNLGATLGELDRPEAAAVAFAQALANDPHSATILNNIGVVNREIGRLEESEQALTRVTALAPGFVFGHYNLGHTRFLRRDYAGALRAYEEGQRRDPEKNRRQGCRLALVRFASGDVNGANRDLWRFADAAPAEEREDLLLEAYETAQALVRADPDLVSQQAFLARIAAELTGYN